MKRPFDFAMVDEAQDIGIAEAKFLSALGATRPNALFFAGDLGQRIFQQAFSWKSLGIDVRGRSYTLRINYRTSHQIRSHADRLLPNSIAGIETIADDADLEEVYNTERHLLYVACTRARDHLLVTGVAPGSEFLRDFEGSTWFFHVDPNAKDKSVTAAWQQKTTAWRQKTTLICINVKQLPLDKFRLSSIYSYFNVLEALEFV
jgi:ATP-dependent exoDNAse (exonuclease V) beta subunit